MISSQDGTEARRPRWPAFLPRPRAGGSAGRCSAGRCSAAAGLGWSWGSAAGSLRWAAGAADGAVADGPADRCGAGGRGGIGAARGDAILDNQDQECAKELVDLLGGLQIVEFTEEVGGDKPQVTRQAFDKKRRDSPSCIRTCGIGSKKARVPVKFGLQARQASCDKCGAGGWSPQ